MIATIVPIRVGGIRAIVAALPDASPDRSEGEGGRLRGPRFIPGPLQSLESGNL